MEKLLSLIITSTVYATVTGLFILTVKLLLKNKLTAKWTYILWLVFILKLIIPFGPQSNLSIFNKIKINNNYSNAYEQIVKEKEELKLAYDVYTITKVGLRNRPRNNLYDKQNTIINSKSLSIVKLINLTWIIGVIFFIAILGMSYFKLLYKLGKETIASERITKIFIKSKKKSRISKNIDLIINKEIYNPAIFGIVRPKIFLPITLMNLSDKEIEFILLHELCHYKRKDNYLCNILLLLQVIHWFNPFIWYLFKIIRKDIEIATDYKVSEVIDSKEIKNYGYTLLTVLSNIQQKKTIPILLSMVNNKKDIEERIMSIKKIDQIRKNKVILTLIGILTVSAVSPLVLTNSTNNIVYGNTDYHKFIKNEKLNTVQMKYFELSSLVSNNSEISLDKVDKILKSPNYVTKSVDKEHSQIIYEYKGQDIILHIDTNNKSKISSVVYNIYNPIKEVALTSISCEDFNELGWKYSIKLSTSSIEQINKISNNLNIEMTKSNLYDNYCSIIKKVEKSNKLEDKVLYDFNLELQNKSEKNSEINYYQTNLNEYYLTVCNINKTKELESMNLASINKSGVVLELLDTYNISQSSNEIIERYNVSKNDIMIHSLSLGNKSLNEIKYLLLQSIE